MQALDLQSIAEQFVQAYYVAMETNRSQMLQFYTDNSIMTFEGQHSKGVKEISEKIESFGFKKVNVFS